MVIATLFPLGWLHYLLGGVCIGFGVTLLYAFTGRVGGMSSFFSALWSYGVKRPFFQQEKWLNSRAWRLFYALGLVLGAALWWLWKGQGVPANTSVPWWLLLGGGFLTGFGTRLGDGCTSGHGICGLGSLQMASLKAVLTFMVTGFLTANLLTRWLV